MLRCSSMSTWIPVFGLATVHPWVAALGIVTVFLFVIANQAANIRRAAAERRDAKNIASVNAQAYAAGSRHEAAKFGARVRAVKHKLRPDVMFREFFPGGDYDYKDTVTFFAGARYVSGLVNDVDISPRPGIGLCCLESVEDLIHGLDDRACVASNHAGVALAVPEIVVCSIVDALVFAARRGEHTGVKVEVTTTIDRAVLSICAVDLAPDIESLPEVSALRMAGGDLRFVSTSEGTCAVLECPIDTEAA